MRSDRYQRDLVVSIVGAYEKLSAAAIDVLRQDNTAPGRKVLGELTRKLRMWKSRLRRLDRAAKRVEA